MNTLEYFEKWFHAKNMPILPLSVDDACKRHDADEPYVALAQFNGQKQVIDKAGEWISVLFLDGLDRVYLIYNFKKVVSGRLFLSHVRHMEFEKEDAKPILVVTFAFNQDGSIVIERRNLISGDIEEKISQGDIASNWEDLPKFGEYQSICRLDRN